MILVVEFSEPNDTNDELVLHVVVVKKYTSALISTAQFLTRLILNFLNVLVKDITHKYLHKISQLEYFGTYHPALVEKMGELWLSMKRNEYLMRKFRN